MVKSSKIDSPGKPSKKPRRPKLKPKKQELPPTKAKVFSDIMNELLSNIVVEPTEQASGPTTVPTCTVPSPVPSPVRSSVPIPRTPIEPSKTTQASVIEDRFISETIITKVAFLFRVVEKLIRNGGLLAKRLWQQVERWVLAMVKCAVMEVTESARVCFDKIIPVRLIQQFHDSPRICDGVRNDEPEADTERAISEKEEPLQTVTPEIKEGQEGQEEEVQEPQDPPAVPSAPMKYPASTPPASTPKSSPSFLSPSFSGTRSKTAFEPRSFRLPSMFPITRGGAKLARSLVKIDAADTYDIPLAPKPFLYHYVSNVTANCCKTGISLFKCKSPY
ncbi:hypothetical protein JA9_004285 [Meyerozyma sp. JA9]|nr:hypothetical protein JA9_004285 [Meyerozyma sp. JA9]